MNALLLQDVLCHRYNSCYSQLWNKLTSRTKQGQVCCSSNHLSSRPVGQTIMHQSLKVKLQNAISQFADADSPALFVGGRRRNRKKRKNKNGQAKRKNKKGQEDPEILITSIAPDFEYYKDVAPIRRPQVTCVDLEDPVFIDAPIKTALAGLKDEDKDSLYSSNTSLDSSKLRLDSGCEEDVTVDDETNIISETCGKDAEKRTQTFPLTRRTYSKDSGVFDDQVDDIITDDASVSDQGIESASELSRPASVCSLSSESYLDTEADDTGHIDTLTRSVNEYVFEDVDLSDSDDIDEGILQGSPISAEIAQALELANAAESEDVTEDTEDKIKIVTELSQIVDSEHILKMEDDDDDIIFDLSQLEVNNTEGELSKSDFQKLLNKGSIYDPTCLEDEVPFKLPMDLLIDDDKQDEVLYEAESRRELSITCNPLYEQTLKDEDDRISVQTYQSGFETNFDNVKFIQIPNSATQQKTFKESAPLLKDRPRETDGIACCVIL